jgi:DNA-binding NarL/FixJ family response regulator
MYQILIADDNTTLTIQLEEYLPTIGYEVKGVASSGLGAVEMARTLKPDLILMDIKMPGKLNGIEAASIIKSELGIDILFISGYADEELLEMAKLVEPLGYIHKPFSDEQIAAAIKMACYQINRNGVWPNTLDELSSAYKNFTVTETRIVQLIKQGKSTNEIGKLLKRSPATVIWHRKNIRKKLGIAETKKDIRSTLLSSEM